MGCRYIVVLGHKLEEYMNKYGEEYNDGKLWDFKPKELVDGTIEPQDGMTYWFIKGRLYETNE